LRRSTTFKSAKLTAEDARDMVVLTVGNAYLLCIADASRIDAVNAELATSEGVAGPGDGIA
jgi:outer membrane protein TolC